MAEKKCPKCGLWNSESAEICDCGFNFLSGKKHLSPSKEAEYERLFRESGVDAVNIHGIHRRILLKIILSLTAVFALPLSSFFQSAWICAASLLLLGVIIYFNVYGRNNYAISLGRRIWKYAFLGILAGFIAGWAIRLALVLSAMEGTKEISSSTALVAIHWVLMYVSGLIGVWIGNRKVLKETTDYIR